MLQVLLHKQAENKANPQLNLSQNTLNSIKSLTDLKPHYYLCCTTIFSQFSESLVLKKVA